MTPREPGDRADDAGADEADDAVAAMGERLMDLEVKLAYQDHVVAQLDEVVRALAARVDALGRELAAVREASRSPQAPLGPAAEKPPHY